MVISGSRWIVALAAVVVVAVLAASAQADDIKTFEVTGDADAGASDSRGVAVDDAFAQATEDALEELLTKVQRTAHRSALNKEVVGRARRWVSSYKVTGDQTASGRRQLAVAVRIDRAALRARLIELQILEDAGGAEPATGPVMDPSGAVEVPPVAGDPRWAGRTSTLLLRVRRLEQIVVSFGATAEREVPGADVATAVMAARGLVVKPASLAGPAPRGDGELPLENEQARALATAARAELAVVVGAELSGRQQVRGVAEPMVLARAVARVVSTGRDGTPGDGRGTAVAIAGDGDRLALDRAIAIAVESSLPAIAPTHAAPPLVADDQPLPPVDGGAWVRVSAKTPWPVVTGLLRQFAKQPGFTAELRRLSPAGYLVLVRSPRGLERAAAIARATPVPEGLGALKVRTDHGVITVRAEAP